MDPSLLNKSADVENNTTTVIISNFSRNKLPQEIMVSLLAATARAMFGNPMLQYLNALTIAAHQAIVDTRAMSLFIMESTNVANKRVAI